MDSSFTTQNAFIDITILVPVTPNLMNRDDQGKPKTSFFGGVERLSPSAQFLKRAWRRASLNGKVLTRTKYAPEMIINLLEEQGISLTDEQKMALTKLMWEKAKKSGRTEGLLFLADSEITAMAKITAANIDILSENPNSATKKAFAKGMKEIYAGIPLAERLVVSLYGRMFAGASENLNAIPDGALMVCKALSTAKVRIATDYFATVDDYRADSTDDELKAQGSSHIGERQFSPGCNLLIQYRIDLNLLLGNSQIETLDDEALAAALSVVMDFIEVSVFRPLCGAAAQGSFSMSARPFYAALQVPKKGSLYDMAPAFLPTRDFLRTRATDTIEANVGQLREYMGMAEHAFREVKAKVEFCMDSDTAPEAVSTQDDFLTQAKALVATALQSTQN